MKITYVGHATLVIEVNGIKIVTDPWVKGAAYCNQWHQFPRALSPDLIKDADYVLYSHGHEDHLHPESLQTIQTNAKIFYPYSWYGGTLGFFKSLGLTQVTEVLNDQTITINEQIKITYLSNNLDNTIVLEINGKVIVNVNDALPSASQGMIKHFIQKINSRWRKIDYVFSSYGGASYFPNAVHFSKKNDLEIAETRELFFVTNFCKIIEGLNPTYAIPFATDFILLDDNQRWINTIKFPRDQIKTLYNQYTKASCAVQIIEAYPNDYFEQDHFFAVSPYHAKKENSSLLETIDSEYAEEIAEKKNPKKLSVSEQETLFKQIEAHILSKQYIIPEEVRKKIKFAVKIADGNTNNVLNIDFRHNATVFSKAAIAEKDVDLLIEIKSQTIDYAINNEWGGDAIIIGYGAEVYIYNFDAVLFEYENYCIRLLSRYPNTKEYLRKTPFRALKYLISDEIKRKNLLNKALGQKDKIIDYTDALLGKRDLWLNKNKCDVCKACNI
jgi:L-ascorbate metabolism protein UlaG (beta-lactamase superfamily)